MTPVGGQLAVISGPSGCGKTTLCRRLAEETDLELSISATTRPRRRVEVDGEDYHFLSPDEFRRRADEGAFAEHAEVIGHLYGTPRAPLEQALRDGKTVLMDIDVQGAAQLMAAYPDAKSIFILPPKPEILRERLTGRQTDTEAEIARRLKTAEWELTFADRYRYHVVNDDLDRAVGEIRAILFPEKERLSRASQTHSNP